MKIANVIDLNRKIKANIKNVEKVEIVKGYVVVFTNKNSFYFNNDFVDSVIVIDEKGGDESEKQIKTE